MEISDKDVEAAKQILPHFGFVELEKELNNGTTLRQIWSEKHPALYNWDMAAFTHFQMELIKVQLACIAETNSQLELLASFHDAVLERVKDLEEKVKL